MSYVDKESKHTCPHCGATVAEVGGTVNGENHDYSYCWFCGRRINESDSTKACGVLTTSSDVRLIDAYSLKRRIKSYGMYLSCIPTHTLYRQILKEIDSTETECPVVQVQYLSDVIALQYMCDECCKYREEYHSRYKDAYEAEERLSIERCENCPISKCFKNINFEGEIE